ncbi:hypothetical protein PRZ48_010678 [Zasmidium cellare]|uniref:DUF6604 domain-containing protein n=1 Tax=Zasmidium cellare TaxID=395010 RepID=A0ABR0E9A7_ZASCE|nr:hypothetical protein PRZ48_010678 [Zasmidium cellare]
MPTQDMMDPIVNRYVRYKAGTKQVVQWLATTASHLCDITAHLDCLKFDFSKPVSVAARSQVQVKTKELLELTSIIVTTEPPISIPLEILVVLEDVINLRQASANWYATQSVSHTGNDGHTFFIKILQEIHGLLSSAKGTPDRKNEQTTLANGKQKSRKQKDSLSNLFECLELEEPSDTPLGHKSGSQVSQKDFECKDFEDDEEDEAFALWCYLADANDTRQFVRQMWLDYRSGDLSLGVAGAVTECAMGMLHRAHTVFVNSHPSLDDWSSFMSYLNFNLAMNKNVVYTFPSTGVNTTKLPPATVNTPDLLCVSAALQLRGYTVASENFSLSIPNSRDHIFKASIGNVQCHRPITVFEKPLFAMIRELTRLTRPVIEGGEELHYRHTQMTDGLLDITCGFAEPDPKEAPLWLVFGTAICMDIAEIVETRASLPGDSLLHTVAYVRHTIDHRLDFHKRYDMERLVPLHRENRLQWDRVLELASTLESALEEGRKLDDPAIYQSMSKDEKLDAHLSKRLLPSLNSLPHNAAEMEYILKIHLHDIAVYAANEQWVVLCLAHIYRAARHYGLINAQWQDLDLVIAHHSSRRPYITKTNVHSDAYTMLRHFLLDLGVEPSKLSGGALPGRPNKETVTKRSKQLTPAETGFRAAFIQRHKIDESNGISRTDLIDVVLAGLTEETHQASQKKGKQKSAKPKVRKFTPAQLLSTMKNELVSDEPRLNFDYATFTTFCLDTMFKMFGMTPQGIPIRLPSGYKTTYDVTYFLLKEVAESQARSTPIQSTAFARAAQILEDILKDGDNGKKLSIAAFNMSSGRIPKTSRPQFPAQPDLEPSLAALQEDIPGMSVGSLRKTVELYDPQGSVRKFEAMLDTPAMRPLLSGGSPSPITVAMLPERRIENDEVPEDMRPVRSKLVIDRGG